LTNIIAIFNNSDTISVDSGQLAFNREFIQDATGTLGVNIADSEFDSYAVGQSATLDGTLTINLLGGFMPAVDATFAIMTYSSLTGTFDSVNGVDIGNGTHFSIIYGANDITLKVVPD